MVTFAKFYLMCGLVIATVVFSSGKYRIKLFGKLAITPWQKFWSFALFAIQAPVLTVLAIIKEI